MSEIDYFQKQRAVLIQQITAQFPAIFGPSLGNSLALSRNPVEYGDTGSITLSFTAINNPAATKLNGVVISGSPQVLNPPDGGWVNPTIETVTLFDANGNQTDGKSVTITPRVPIFIGLASTAVPSHAEIVGAKYIGLDSDAIARSTILEVSAGGFIFVAYPAAFDGYDHGLTLTTISLGPVVVGGWTVADVPVTLETGKQVPMHVAVLPTALPAGGAPTGVTLA